MSGTSADGVDAALVQTDGEASITVIGGLTVPYEEDLRHRLLEASQHDMPTSDMLRLEKELTQVHADAVAQLIKQHPAEGKRAEVVGFHGHTIRHIPDECLTCQIGNPWQLAHSTGLKVVSDFRRNDIAGGGQGAPLAAMFHRALFDTYDKPLVVLNLGGVANVTWLGEDGALIAGDTGPGCGLLDEWAQEMADLPHDSDGILAGAGRVNEPLVAEALSAPFFARPLPKAADRYDFDHVDVSTLTVEDGAATLCAVTVRAVAGAVARLPKKPKTLWVTGGGVKHPVIMSMLAEHFAEVHRVEDRKLSSETLEAECFAWLAVRRMRQLPITVPETTGCSEPLSGGAITL
ncbi:Anhydro-N-acetylmuramic acid kinase [Botrimarina colliarenosi]|uniref:Anhydro-N-acetylmuramic acid kinase n=2 Tax=Botrimarina colliarenosi TaxID=2528001 RepID=A0A5C6A1L1_9BACT|nr:Anhydro-N-acetylmuramic acid kinase [Botrimarina colliarenosi]